MKTNSTDCDQLQGIDIPAMSKDFANLYLYEEMRSSLAITQKTFLAQNNHDSSNSHAKNTIFNIKILKISIARCNSNKFYRIHNYFTK